MYRYRYGGNGFRRRRPWYARGKWPGFSAFSRAAKYIPPELKFIDNEYADNDLGVAGNWATTGRILLNGMAVGNSVSTRVGNVVALRSITLRLSIDQQATSSGTGRLRLIIFLDRQANGQTPAIGDVLQDASVEGLQNLANRKRFFMIADHVTPFATNLGNENSAVTIVGFKKFKRPVRVQYSGTDALAASIATNALWCWLMADHISTAGPTVDGWVRIRYQDP